MANYRPIYRGYDRDSIITGPQEIDYTAPLIDRHSHLINLDEGVGSDIELNYARRNVGVLVGAVYPQTASISGSTYEWLGKGLKLNSGSLDTLITTTSGIDTLAKTGGISMAVRFRHFGYSPQGSSVNAIAQFGSLQLTLSINSGDNLVVYAAGSAKTHKTTPKGEWVTIVVVHDGASSFIVTENKVTTHSFNNLSLSSGKEISIGGDYVSANRYADCEVEFVHFYDKALSLDIAKRIVSEPYTFYQKRDGVRSIPVEVGGATFQPAWAYRTNKLYGGGFQ